MWERFTQPARRATYVASLEASEVGANDVDTEHLLLGLLRGDQTVAVLLLEECLAIPRLSLLKEIGKEVRRGEGTTTDEKQLTAHSRRAIELAYDEAQSSGENYIGTEHLLLGLAREQEGIAGGVLRKFGADAKHLRQEVQAMQAGKGSLVQRVKDQFLKAVERDTGLPVLPVVRAVTVRGPEKVADEIIPLLALSSEDRKALQSIQSPRERLEKLSGILETATVSLGAPDHRGHEPRTSRSPQT